MWWILVVLFTTNSINDVVYQPFQGYVPFLVIEINCNPILLYNKITYTNFKISLETKFHQDLLHLSCSFPTAGYPNPTLLAFISFQQQLKNKKKTYHQIRMSHYRSKCYAHKICIWPRLMCIFRTSPNGFIWNRFPFLRWFVKVSALPVGILGVLRAILFFVVASVLMVGGSKAGAAFTNVFATNWQGRLALGWVAFFLSEEFIAWWSLNRGSRLDWFLSMFDGAWLVGVNDMAQYHIWSI